MNDVARIGHNLPPIIAPDKEAFRAQLETEHAELFNRASVLDAAADKAPDRIADDDTQGKASELIKQMRLCESDLEARRKLEKAPWTEIGATVDSAFNGRKESLKAKRDRLNERAEAYTKAKKAAEERRLAEEAERRREQVARDLASAQAAEERRRQAEWDTTVAEAERENAEWDRDNADRLRREAEAKAAAARAEQARLEIERKAALARKVEEDATTQKRIDDLRAERERQEIAAAKARADLAVAVNQKIAAENEGREARADAKAAGRDEKAGLDAALREEKRAERLEEKIEQDALGRTRSEHGAVATTGRRWVSEIIDRDRLDKAKLWPFIATDAIEIALRKWMMVVAVDNRKMPGAKMQEIEEGRII